jgi:hypothetical protein
MASAGLSWALLAMKNPGKPFRGCAAGVLGGEAVAAELAVHLRTVRGLDRGNGQVCIEAAPKQGFLRVRVAQVVRVEGQAPRR